MYLYLKGYIYNKHLQSMFLFKYKILIKAILFPLIN